MAAATGLRRTFVTPEAVDLRLELGSAGSRAAAFMIDVMIILVILGTITAGMAYLLISVLALAKGGAALAQAIAVLWLVGAFVLRNGWFSLFELGGRGATPGKRLLGLRVVARDGGALSGSAVIARNAMREVEVFLPLSFLAAQAVEGLADTFLVIFALLWSGIFLLFPLFNRDRLRLGDLVAGTWVVVAQKAALSYDLVGASHRPGRSFSREALALYGVYELQTLEKVLRNEDSSAIAAVATTIGEKTGMLHHGDHFGFLTDYYAALCAHLESELSVGRRKDNKFVQ